MFSVQGFKVLVNIFLHVHICSSEFSDPLPLNKHLFQWMHYGLHQCMVLMQQNSPLSCFFYAANKQVDAERVV